jgi:N6-adenosine-specific RNA methylase IME4
LTLTKPKTLGNKALTIFRYQRHQLAANIPEMDTAALAALVKNVRRDGLDCPIVVYKGRILDGWARYQACLAANVQPEFREFDVDRDGDPLRFVLRQAFSRKHWKDPQRAMVAARLVTSRVGFNQNSEGTTINAAAEMANVTTRLVDHARRVQLESPIVADAVANGRIPSMRVAKTLAELPDNIQQLVLSSDSSGPALKKEIHAAERKWKLTQPIVIPEGRFAVIVADPPWPMDKTPYATMTLAEVEEDLGSLLAEKAADDCHLFLWTTQGNLHAALNIIQRLGWTYTFKMTWRKAKGPKHPAGPMYNDEFIIAATKGSPHFIDTRDFKTCFEGTQRSHSEKPDEFFETIKRVTAAPRLELYARKRHDGFASHGNEVSEITAFEVPLVPTPTAPLRRRILTSPQMPNFLAEISKGCREKERC